MISNYWPLGEAGVYMLTLTLRLMKRTILLIQPSLSWSCLFGLSQLEIVCTTCLCLENAAVESGTVDLTSLLQVFWRLISPWDELGTDLHQLTANVLWGTLLSFLHRPPCWVFVRPSTHSMYSVSPVPGFLGLQYRSGGVPAIHVSQTAGLSCKRWLNLDSFEFPSPSTSLLHMISSSSSSSSVST